jgi:hypothetical protein
MVQLAHSPVTGARAPLVDPYGGVADYLIVWAGRATRPFRFPSPFPHWSLLLLDELREAWRSESRDDRTALLCFLVIAIDLRLLYLRQPMRYDEAVTYMYFVRFPWQDALSLYTYPNNHLFHTLLAKASVTVFGNSPWALRLPAFLAGVLLVPATYAVARAIYGARAALFATGLVAASGVLTLYSTTARGYSIVALAFLLLVLQAIRLMRGAPSGEWIIFAVIAALGLWTIPVMLYPLGTVCLWFALSAVVDGKRTELRRMFIALGVAAGLTILAYAPVISREGIAAVTSNKFVQSSTWLDFFEELPVTLREAVTSWSLGLPLVAAIALAACALLALAHHAKLSRIRVGIPLAAFVWSAWLLVVNHRAPFARVWLWLVPIAASLAAAGVVALMERWAPTRRLIAVRAPAMAVGLSFGAALSVVLSYAVLVTRDTGMYREADEASAVLAKVLRPGDRVLAGIPTNGPLAYYLDRRGASPDYLTLDERSARRIFAIFDGAEGQDLGQLVARSPVRDSTQFGPPKVVAEFQSSAIVVFSRRNVPAK